MKRILLVVLAAASLLTAAPGRPRLVLFIVVDQCRYDYLTRFRKEFTGGFDRLLKNGASFTSAEDDFFPTLTAVSHATLLTGAMPSQTGIIGNEWLDRQTGKHVTSVSDRNSPVLGSHGAEGASPRQLLVPTVGDELKKANGGRPRVIGISQKDRSAILLAGQKPDAAYWLDDHSGLFVTSRYYTATLPDWVRAFDDRHPADRYVGLTWEGHTIAKTAKTPYKPVDHSPFGTELTEALAERAIEAEKLGRHEDTDLLALSFSSTDHIGHDYGPDTPEMYAALLKMDRELEKLLQAVDRAVGLSSVLVVMTSDHGIPLRLDGSYKLKVVTGAVQTALAAKYGPGKWVAGCWDQLLYVNQQLVAQKKLDAAEVNRTAALALLHLPHMARAYTREELMAPNGDSDKTRRLMQNGFNAARAADIVFQAEPNWLYTNLLTTHGSTYDYDTHVPLIFMGAGIKPGSYSSAVRSNDVAPTLAEILGIPKPSGSVGRVLSEMFSQ